MTSTKKDKPAPAQEAEAQVIAKFIQEMDWDAFWTRVMARTSPQIEAYQQARVRSLETAQQHVFM